MEISFSSLKFSESSFSLNIFFASFAFVSGMLVNYFFTPKKVFKMPITLPLPTNPLLDEHNVILEMASDVCTYGWLRLSGEKEESNRVFLAKEAAKLYTVRTKQKDDNMLREEYVQQSCFDKKNNMFYFSFKRERETLNYKTDGIIIGWAKKKGKKIIFYLDVVLAEKGEGKPILNQFLKHGTSQLRKLVGDVSLVVFKLEAIDNVIKFYQDLGFKYNGDVRNGLQPMKLIV